MFSSFLTAPFRSSVPSLVRSLHSRTPLSYSIEDGLPPFLSPAALNTIAVDYQQGLLEHLNDAVRDTPHENSSVYKTILDTAGDRSQILTFNYACEALNNAFFLDKLSPSPKEPTYTDHGSLLTKIDSSLGTMTEFKALFSSAAMGMSGSGWIWLVMDRNRQLGILPTYGPGTVLIQHREERVDLHKLVDTSIVSNQQESESESESQSPSPSTSQTHAQSPSSSRPSSSEESPFSSSSSNTPSMSYFDKVYMRRQGHGKRHYFPLLALSIHEHAWMQDYGVWGKEDYVRNFWDVVDWTKVNNTIASYERS